LEVATRLNLGYLITICTLLVLYAWALYNIPILVVGVRHLRKLSRKKGKRSPLSEESLPMVSIIVPARDEEKVVGRLLTALLDLDYPPKKKEIIIVEDGSKDKTVKICGEYARSYPNQIKLLHRSTSNGKPSALNYALKHVRGEIVAVFDADNVPEPDVLIKAAEYFEDPSIAAVQGKPCSINADENILTKFVSYEEAVRYEAYMRGKDMLNLFVHLTGSCCFVRKSVLDEVGGWDDECLSEDVELSARLVERGYRIKYAPDVRSWQEYPANFSQFFKQRTRWFRGCMEVSLKYGKLLRRFNRRCFDAEVTLFGPFMFLPFLMGYLLGIYSFLDLIQPDVIYMVMTQGTMLLTTVTLFLIGMALFYMTKPRRITNILWLPFVYGYWSLQSFIALYAFIQIVLRRPKRWMKTVKTGKVTNGVA
jgi:cellulose synthase/poly-beta-1,6-N-acetylglucosamine synthase-like glycosyltransferase